MEKKNSDFIDIQTVKYIAHLARVELSPDELEEISYQLKKIIEFINLLKELDVSEIPATSHILSLKNVLRDDIPEESLSIEKVLKCAPSKKDNFFVVPKIIE